jgi:hypothetical protein
LEKLLPIADFQSSIRPELPVLPLLGNWKLYNELVKSPQAPLALEKERPSLVAARDKAFTAAKRKQLQKETAQIPGHVSKMHR